MLLHLPALFVHGPVLSKVAIFHQCYLIIINMDELSVKLNQSGIGKY